MPACVYYGTPELLPSRVDLAVFLPPSRHLNTSTPSFPLADNSDHLSLSLVMMQPVNKHPPADRTTSDGCGHRTALRVSV